MTREDLDLRIIEDYRTVARALDRVVLPILVERGVTMSQMKALIAVTSASEAGITITNLGTELSIGQPSASLITDQLVKAGYAERQPDESDRRRVLVRATEAGEELVAELRHGRRSEFAEWLGGVVDSDADALARGLHALAQSVLSAKKTQVGEH
jgi:DNA-binding MarR family transcriptional regulator